MKSKVVKHSGKLFRYNDGMLQIVCKAKKSYYKDNEEFQAECGKDLWDIDEDGYIMIYEEGLSRENWEDKESREYYMDILLDDYREESYWLEEDYKQFG